MNTIKHYKKEARARAAANASSHQAELNAIALENGHANWGSFQRALQVQKAQNRAAKSSFNTDEIEVLLSAYRAARRAGGHLVVLRENKEAEEVAIERLQEFLETETHSEGIAYTAFLSDVAMETAEEHGQTLVAGSGSMARDTNHGNFIVHNAGQALRAVNALTSLADQQAISATMNLTVAISHSDAASREELPSGIGPTTIRRTSRTDQSGGQ